MKKKSLKTLTAKLDKVFSDYIRLKAAKGSWENSVQCVTCKSFLPAKQAHCGHFIKRQHRATRWLEINAYPQCPRCNVYMGGRQDDMALHIIQTHGLERFNGLMSLKHKTVKYTPQDLEQMIEKFSSKA